ncbi:MAG TPA: hypothetical protein PK990_11040, partial [Salinivirgaceae bacterium]|nr:hypothetical protein [Salinivirgaceae bacterium]
MIVKKFSLLIPIIILTILNGCNHNPETESDQTSETDTLIVVTQHQFDANGMVLGSIEKKLFEERLSANALVIPLSDGYARVSSPIGGVVKNINIKNG